MIQVLITINEKENTPYPSIITIDNGDFTVPASEYNDDTLKKIDRSLHIVEKYYKNVRKEKREILS